MEISRVMFALALPVAICSSCSDNNDTVREEARNSLNVQESVLPPGATNELPETNVPAPGAQPAAPQQPAQNNINSTVDHYICPNSCEGSGGATQVSCPICGTQYVHNAAYHNQPAAPTTTTPQTQINPAETAGSGQNAAGVWHYTCPSGCSGGSGSAGSCATCGAALAHNAAYHN